MLPTFYVLYLDYIQSTFYHVAYILCTVFGLLPVNILSTPSPLALSKDSKMSVFKQLIEKLVNVRPKPYEYTFTMNLTCVYEYLLAQFLPIDLVDQSCCQLSKKVPIVRNPLLSYKTLLEVLR